MKQSSIRWHFEHREARRSCSAYNVIRRLLKQDRLPHFRAEFGNVSPDLGNCHDVCEALYLDLIMAHQSEGWRLLSACLLRPDGSTYLHSWLEFDGWTVDPSEAARQRIVTVGRAEERRQSVIPGSIKRDWDRRDYFRWAMADDEVHHMLGQKLRVGNLTESEYRNRINRLNDDRLVIWILLDVPNDVVAEAARKAHLDFMRGIDGFDHLHLASAMHASAEVLPEEDWVFVTSDHNLIEYAKENGLKCFDPIKGTVADLLARRFA